ncbi:MAG: SIMPL domain-containing protein [Dehalococcoidia bacterium]|nr:SIMPL domain-containing protein [Dehalococcoidia bacterium]
MKKIWIPVLAIVVALTLFGAAGCCDSDAENGNQAGISVTGEGKVSATPDLVTVTLGIEAQAKTVNEAQTQAADAMNKVMDSLKNGGLADKDIQTSQFSIYPITKWDEDTQQQIVLGYRVSNMVTAKIRDLGKAGQIIDAVAVAGGDLTRVQGIYFSIEYPVPYQMQAREKAFADARAKAEQMANLAKVKLDDPISISESSGYVSPVRMDYASKDEGSSSMPISPGEQEISVSVYIVYGMD